MQKQRITLLLGSLELNSGQLGWLPRNPRQWTRQDVDRMVASLNEDPDFMEDRPPLVVANTEKAGKYVVFGGNMRITAEKERKAAKAVNCILYVPETEDDKTTILRRAMKDNGSFGAWDMDILANEWDGLPLVDFGVPAWDTSASDAADYPGEETEEEMIARKEREFRERMAAGEISEEDPEYQEFLEKFKLKKTTDDCYTPALVYDAVADWVAKEYGVSKAKFVRPFYPGGDYQRETYAKGCVVVDNPPFSILAEIMRFYSERGIRFFLFGPTLTLFSSSSSSTAIPVSVAIVYENGASVNTSFLTNLEDPAIRFRSAPTLYAAVKAANDANLAQQRKELPKYAYDHHIVTAPFVGALSRLGIDFVVPVSESEGISALDEQKESGKAIYGKGYIVSDRIFAEREKAEREKAERWELSARELQIVERLNRKEGKK